MWNAVFTTMPMFVCLFWTVILLIQYKKADRAKRMLSVFMSVATLLYFAHCTYFNHKYSLIPFTDTVYTFANVAVYPLYFLYITSLTSHHKLSWRNYLLLLPAAVLCAATGICYLTMDNSQTTSFMNEYLYKVEKYGLDGITRMQALIHDTVKYVFAMQLIPVLYLGWRKIAKYDKLLTSYYSYIENKSLDMIKDLLLCFVITTIASFAVNIVGKSWFASSVGIIAIPSVLFSALLFAIGYIGMKTEYTADELSDLKSKEAKYGVKGQFETKEELSLKQKIIEVMEREKLYTKQNLKISDLAHIMGTNRNYIYNSINIGMGISFSEFVNRYRVLHAQRLIEDYSTEKNMSTIWMESGFSSETSFYRNFRLYAGCSPQRWKSTSYSH